MASRKRSATAVQDEFGRRLVNGALAKTVHELRIHLWVGVVGLFVQAGCGSNAEQPQVVSAAQAQGKNLQVGSAPSLLPVEVRDPTAQHVSPRDRDGNGNGNGNGDGDFNVYEYR